MNGCVGRGSGHPNCGFVGRGGHIGGMIVHGGLTVGRQIECHVHTTGILVLHQGWMVVGRIVIAPVPAASAPTPPPAP